MTFTGLTGNIIAKELGLHWNGLSPRSIESCEVDSRRISRGDLFIALKGPRFDGHDFIKEAIANGATGLIVTDPDKVSGHVCPYIVVSDAVSALVKLSCFYRKQFRGNVVAITGSSGKTTTKEILKSIFDSSKIRNTVSKSSFNNHIGVPLTILSSRMNDEVLICELGTSSLGEIDYLGSIVSPNYAIITQLGQAHLEGLGMPEDIVKEKLSLIKHVKDSSFVVLPSEAPFVSGAIYVGTDEGVGKIQNIRSNIKGMSFQFGGRSWNLSLRGEHNVRNASMAIVVARRLGLSDANIARGLSSVKIPEGRGNLQLINGIEIINDAYNANPDSMRAGIKTFLESFNGFSALMVLGEMEELGIFTESAHISLGNWIFHQIKGLNIKVIFVGKSHECFKKGMECSPHLLRTYQLLDKHAISEIIKEFAISKSIYIKASRSMRLELLIKELKICVASG